MEALCLWKNLCSWKNQKQKKVLGKKNNKKQAQTEKERVPLCQVKKKFLRENDLY